MKLQKRTNIQSKGDTAFLKKKVKKYANFLKIPYLYTALEMK